MRNFFLVLILSLFISHISAQEKDIVFEQITNESGRSLGFITGIIQDEIGFLWFATKGGLYRYNGYSYKLFRRDPSDSLSLANNNIAHIYIDNEQIFWMRHLDRLTAFKNEKLLYGFDSITSKSLDMDVKIVQDKKGNYWVGPSKEGLLKYNHSNKNVEFFKCPPNTYSPTIWQKFESLLTNNKTIATITPQKNNADTSVTFPISKKGKYLIASLGEMDKYGKYDFGTLYKNGDKIWELSADKSMWAGGEEKNIFEAAPIELEPGTYTISYKSDLSHSCGNWDGEGPDKITFCGVRIVELTSSDYNEISANMLRPFRDSNYIESEIIKDMIIDNNGVFWALTDKGLEKYNSRKNIFEHFPINFKELLGAESNYLRIFQDKKGAFWIGSMYGLIKYDHLWGRFDVFQNQEEKKKKVLTSNKIHSIFEDNNSQIWIGTDRGLNIYNPELKTVKKVTRNNHNRLYHDFILEIFEDKGGNIWVATAEGLNRLIKTQFTFTDLKIEASNNYPAIYDNAANIWYALGNQVSKYSRTLQTAEDYILPDNLFNIEEFTGEADYIINDMVISSDQNVWVATDNKVSRLNIFTKKVDYSRNIGAIIVGSDSIKNSVKKLIVGTSSKVYAFCPNGLYIINSNDFALEGYFPFQISHDFIDEVDANYFKNARIDKKGNIWIRTSAGIYQFNPILQKLALIYEFDSGLISGGKFDLDKYGNIWFATLPLLSKIDIESLKITSWECKFEHDWTLGDVKIGKEGIYIYGSNGLYTFNTELEEFTYASIENGFIDNSLNGLEEDNLGYLWLTSLKGLIKYDPEENNSKNYFTNADFSTHRFLGNPSEFIISSSEKILFTTTGFITFHPDSINKTIPPIVIDKITIKGKEKLDSLSYYKTNLYLKYNQNRLDFEFAALDYTIPSENRYKYILEGLDEEWNIADANNRRASYPGLAPGKYTLKISGSNNDKVWNEAGAQIDIIITPPWYKTLVAYLAYLILILSSIWIFVKVRERQLQEEKQILEQKVKERTAQIESQKEVLAEQKDVIEKKNRDMEDSIQYAQRIQEAILPPIEEIREVVDEYFVLWRPRDIVSGDYYWSARRDDITIIVAADCTGHGVPGAFMSMLGIAFLNEIVNKEGITKPNEILNRLREQVMTQLHQTGEDGESKDGMDVSLYVIDHKNMKLRFAGAYNPLYVIRDSEVIQLKADRMPIGYYIKLNPFTMEEMDLQKGDCLYNSSDGYPDQFGGPDERKFMTKRFKQLLIDIHQKPMAEQRTILDTTIDEWRGPIEQIDDIIVIGVRI